MMGDMGDVFRDLKAEKKERQEIHYAENFGFAVAMTLLGECVQTPNPDCYRFGTVDFWPSTGKWWDFKKKKLGSGHKSLRKYLGIKE